MSDISSQDFNRLIDSLQNVESSISRAARSTATPRAKPNTVDDRIENAKRKALVDGMDKVVKTTASMDREFNNLYHETKEVAGQTKHVIKNFKEMTAWMSLGAIGAVGVIKSMKETVGMYREMLGVGQSFGGSMLKMQIAASSAALPLEEFGKLVTENNLAIASAGLKTFTDLGKGVRDNLRQFSMLGLTTSQVNEYLGEYMETQRLYGLSNSLNSSKAAQAMSDLAVETTKMSTLTGKSRADILKASQAAARDQSFSSRMMLETGENAMKLSAASNKALSYMGALPGEAGELLSTMLAQTIGKGSAVHADAAIEFQKAGMGHIIPMMDSLARQIESGEITDNALDSFRGDLLAVINSQFAGVKNLADFNNSEGAKQIMGMAGVLRSLEGKTLADITASKGAASALLEFEEVIKRISGFFRTQFYTSIETFINVFKEFEKGATFRILADGFAALSARFQTFLTTALTQERVETFAKFLLSAATFGMNMVDSLASLVEGMSGLQIAFTGLAVYLSTKFVAGIAKAYLGKGLSVAKDMANNKFGSSFGALGALPTRPMFVSIVGGGRGGIGGRGRGRGRGRAPGRIPGRTTGSGRGRTPGRTPSRTTGSGRGRTPGRTPGVPPRSRVPSGLGGKRGIRPPKINAPRTGGFLSGLKNTAKVVGKGAGPVGKSVSNMGARGLNAVKGLKGIGSFGKFTAGAMLATGANLALDQMGDFKGKQLAQMGLSTASGASTGAMIGSVVPGIGTAIGGAVGGLVGGGMHMMQNWDAVAADTKAVMDLAATSAGEVLGSIGESAKGALSWITGAFNPKDPKSIVGTMVGDAAQIAGNASLNANTTVSGVRSPVSDNQISLDMAARVEEISALRTLVENVTKDNTELRQTMAKLYEVIALNTANMTSGMIEQINEAKKNTRALNAAIY